MNFGIDIDDLQLSILLYADDVALIAPDAESLQLMLNNCMNGAVSGDYQLTVTKLKLFTFDLHQYYVVTTCFLVVI